jgi:hemolysin activation/secretion protein
MIGGLMLSFGQLQAAAVNEIQVRGATVLSSYEISAVTDPYIGRELHIEDVAAIINTLNGLYSSKGYLNSGVTFPQQPSDSSLLLEAVEGGLTQIDVVINGRLSASHIDAVIRSELSGPLNVNQLQSAFSRLEQQPTIEAVKGRLEPGDAPGESRLALEVVEADAFSFTVNANNYRSPSVGNRQLQLQLQHINLTGEGDTLNVGIDVTEGMDSGSIAYSYPVPVIKSRLGAFYSMGDTVVVEAPFDEIDLRSDIDAVGVSIETAFVDTASRSISSRFGIEKKTSNASLLGLPFDFNPGSVNGVSKATVVTAALSFQQRSAAHAIAARIAVRQGIDAMDATISTTGQADGKFSLWQLQLTYVKLFERQGADWTFSMAANGQFSGDTLQAFERYALGGHGSIRGYRENQVLRDQAWEIRTQLVMPIYEGAPIYKGTSSDKGRSMGSRLSIYPFVDVGEARNAETQANVRQSVTLGSVGLGVKYEIGAFTGLLEWAERFKEKQEQDNTLQDKGIHLGVSYAL